MARTVSPGRVDLLWMGLTRVRGMTVPGGTTMVPEDAGGASEGGAAGMGAWALHTVAIKNKATKRIEFLLPPRFGAYVRPA